jgi:cholesterol transport system auxiliary component
MRYVVLVAILLFAGCAKKEIRPDNFRLEPKTTLHVKSSLDNRVLRVQRVEGDSAVMTRAILYKKDGALKPYRYGRWSELLATRLQDIFTEAIESQKIFRATLNSRSFAMADLILESSLKNFEEIYSSEGSSVHVKIRFRLIQREGVKMLDTILIDVVKPIEQKGAIGVVLAHNSAVEEVILELGEWLYEQSK